VLPDGTKVMGVVTVRQPVTSETFVSTTLVFDDTDELFRACVIANRMIGSGRANNGGGVVPIDYGELLLADEGVRWVRGWDESSEPALLAAYKLWRSGHGR